MIINGSKVYDAFNMEVCIIEDASCYQPRDVRE